MRLSLELVVIIIVILIVAVVILAFFIQGINNADQLMESKNQCIILGSSSCKSLRVLPPTWSFDTIRIGNEMWSCEGLTDIKDCDGFGVNGGGTTPPNTDLECTTQGGTCKTSCDAATEDTIGNCDNNKKCCKAKTT